MKKLYILSAVIFCSMTMSAEYTVPYGSNLGLTKNDVTATKLGLDKDWESIDVASDATFVSYTKWWKDTWAYPSLLESDYKKAGYAAGAVIYHSAGAPDDYLVSPEIKFEAGKTYRVRFAVLTDKADMTYRLTGALVHGQELEDVQGAKTFFDDNINTANEWMRKGYKFSVAETGAYNISLHQCGEKGSRFQIADFSVVEDTFIPSSPKDLTVVTGSESDPKAINAVLTWVNPTTDRDGIPFEEGKGIETVNVYRDNLQEPVAKLSPTTVTWTDNATTGLKAGNHTYYVSVTAAGAESDKINLTTEYIGDVVPIELPCELTFVSQNDFDKLWKSEDGEGHTMTGTTNHWRFSASPVYGNSLKFMSVASTATKPQTQNTWAFSPEFEFKTAGKYELHLNVSYYKSSKPTYDHIVEVLLGTGNTISGWNTVSTVSETLPYSYSTLQDGEEREPIEFEVKSPGKYRLALHAKGAGSGVSFNFYKIGITGKDGMSSIEKIEKPSSRFIVMNGKTAEFSSEASEVVVMSTVGMLLCRKTNVMSVDLSSLTSGIYIIRALINGKYVTIKTTL